MKRRDVLRMIATAARERGRSWQFVRQGADHEVWSLDGRRVTIPRHREINEVTARGILKAFEEDFGRRWWEV